MKRHWLAIILAVIIGLIVGLPHILIPKIIVPEKYDPLQFSYGEGSSITMEEVYTYVPEVREVLEGKFWVTDTQVAEYNGKSTPFVGETGLAWIMAGLAKLTGSIENAFIVADFVFPAVTFLLVYAIVIMITRLPRPAKGGLPPEADRRNDGRILAIAVGAVVVLWPEIIALIPYPAAILSSIKSAFNPRDFLFISRNFHPQLSLPPYLFAFLLLLKALRSEKYQILLSGAAGIAFGFLFYTYIFNWTAFGLGVVLFLIYKIVSLTVKRPGLAAARPGLIKLPAIIAIAGLIAIPYFFQIWQFRQSGLSADFFQKLSLPKRGFFDLTARHIIFFSLFIIAKRKSWTWREALFGAFWLAPILMPDLAQAIFDRDLEGKHWVRRIGYPMSIMGLGLIAGGIKRKWINAAAGIILSAAFVYGVTVQANMSRKVAAAYAVDENKQKLYDFINQQLPPGSVAASLDWDAIVNIPAKTHAFNFSPIGMRTIAPIEETLDRFLWAAAIYGKSEDWVRQAFGDNGAGTTRVYYFAHADENKVFNLPAEIQDKAVLRYQDIKQRFLAGEKPPFRLDYVLSGPTEAGNEKLRIFQFN